MQQSATEILNLQNVYKLLVGAVDGDVYAARVDNEIYCVTIGSGHYATWFWTDYATDFPTSTELIATTYSTIYASNIVSIRSGWDLTNALTKFTSEGEMLSAFYATYVEPDVTNTIVVRITASSSDDGNDGGNSEPDYGGGSFDDNSDLIPLPNIPSISAVNSGLINIFRPSLNDLRDLGNYLWTNVGNIPDNIKKIINNPIEFIIAFHIMPVYPEVGEAQDIKLGVWNAGATMPPVLSQWQEIDFGTIKIEPYWGSALDYAPYTKITAFLPFIGSVPLNTDEVMGSEIRLIYRFDLLSGQCVALIGVNNSFIYQFTGEAAITVPVTSADWTRLYQAAVSAVGAAGIGIVGAATAGASTGLAGQTATARLTESVGTTGIAFSDLNATSKGVAGVASMRTELLTAAHNANMAANQIATNGVKSSKAIAATALTHSISNVAGNVMSAKGYIQHSGNISGSVGLIGIRRPYILVEYPNQSLAENYKHYLGYPSNMFYTLGSLTGYTECESVLVSGIHATDSEIAEITDALKAGVYL